MIWLLIVYLVIGMIFAYWMIGDIIHMHDDFESIAINGMGFLVCTTLWPLFILIFIIGYLIGWPLKFITNICSRKN